MPRKILLLITDLEIGGTPTVVRELATRLSDPPNVEIEVACLKRWGPVADQLRERGIPVTAFEAERPWDLPATVRKLRELVRERRIDTVFSFLIHANTVAALASRKLPGVRFIQSIQTVQKKPRWHWWVQARIHRCADQVVGPSTAVADVARERCGVPPEKLIVIPNAVDPAAFPRVDVFQDPKRIRVGFLGRLDPVKNLPLFIYNISWLGRDDVEGHIFGDGPMRRELEQLPVWPDPKTRIVFHGAVARPQDALGQMDLLFFPSGGEGFGLVLIEAMASGVPVAALDAGGIRDVVQDGYNGLLLKWDQHPYRDLMPGLLRLINDAALRDRLVENGLRTVREKYTWDVILPRYRELLRLP